MPTLHKNITASADIHNPKWFPDASNGDVAWRNEKGELESTDELVLPAALNFVDASVAPPTTNDGDIYVLSSGGSVHVDWGAVSLDDWVRYDGSAWNSITPQKSSLCYDKTTDALQFFDGTNWAAVATGIQNLDTATKSALTPSTGDFVYDTDLDSLQRYDGASWVDLAKGYGIVSINSSNGIPTFYASLTSAFAAASSGDTVFLHSDITETGNVTITIPSGVSWNLNGYTYTLDGSDNTAVSYSGTATNTRIYNGKIVKQNSPTTGGGGDGLSISGTPFVNCENLVVISDGRYCLNFNTTTANGSLLGGSFIYNGTGTSFVNINAGKSKGCYFDNGGGTLRISNGNLTNSKVIGNVELDGSSVFISNVNIISSSSTFALLIDNGGSAYNCFIYNSTYSAVGFGSSSNGKAVNCTAISDGLDAFYINDGELHNCYGYSSAGYGGALRSLTAKAFNCTFESSASAAVYLKGFVKKCSAISTWNNVAGDAFTVFANNFEIIDCYAEVANSSAFAVDGTYSGFISGLKGKGMTTLVGTTTNSMSSAPDTYDNGLIA